ncbi:MAG: hypothetical protein LBO08_02150 [Rickettsiales bacterium]|jgi:hypothetical protein|nr:hypothetical protein [Rickettsiales bacterium]
MRKFIYLLSFIFCLGGAFAADLSGTATIERSAASAAAAKTNALSSARRDIFIQVGDRYADHAAVAALADKLSGGEIENLIANTAIEDEKISATNYAATIKINFDESAVKKLFAANGIANSLAYDVGDNAAAVIYLTNGLRDWKNINAGLDEIDGLNMSVKSIGGGRVQILYNAAKRRSLINALGALGWNAATEDGMLKFNK